MGFVERGGIGDALAALLGWKGCVGGWTNLIDQDMSRTDKPGIHGGRCLDGQQLVHQLAIEAIREVDAMPASQRHFFGASHTRSRYETAFYSPFLSDWRNFETWAEAGSPDSVALAHARVGRMLADYQAPAIDPGTAEALQAFVDRRKASEPDAFG